MKSLLDNDLILCNPFVGCEHWLHKGDDFVEMWSELCNKKLWDDFIHNVAKAYRPEMMSNWGISNFRNENNERRIYPLGHSPIGEEKCDCFDDIISCGWPELLVKCYRVIVKSRNFEIWHVEQSRLDFIWDGDPAKLRVFILSFAQQSQVLKIGREVDFLLLEQGLVAVQE